MSSQINVTVVYFASAKDATGIRKESFKLFKDAAIEDLISKILRTHPKITHILNTVQISVNYKVADSNTILKENDEVAILPPISGG
jgi:molybdopterin synthase catalytic subunit